MAIRFRCAHCGQFLGISQSRAGQVVDCPGCGRSIRVPTADGKRAPIPAPSFDHQDPELGRALDELATLTDGAAETDTPEPATAESTAQSRDSASAPISVAPLPKAAPVQALQRSHAPAARPVPGEVAPPVVSPAPKTTSVGQDAFADLAAVGSQFPQPLERRLGATRRSRDWTWPTVLISLAVAICIATFSLGYILGRQQALSNAAKNSTINPRDDADPAQPGAVPAPVQAASAKVTGRITFRTSTSEVKTDSGACVLLLPQARKGTAKVPVAGLRPADASDDFNVASAALKAVGGVIAIADQDGRFEIEPPATGAYYILVLSHFQERKADAEVDSNLQKVLETFFDRPNQLLGRTAYHFDFVRCRPGSSEIRDVTFAPAT